MAVTEKALISGLGSFLPEKRMTNKDFEKIIDTSDEWIMTRTGIKERRIASDTEFPSTMGTEAAKKALDHAGVDPKEVDAIITSSMTKEFISPATSAIIQHNLGANKAAVMDIESACTGFLSALSVAKAWIESNMYETVLVVTTEKNSAFIDYKDRKTCVLFGDGSGAAVVQKKTPNRSGYLIEHLCLGADGSQYSLITIPAGGSRNPASQTTISEKSHFLQMSGKEVFKQAVRHMGAAATECLAATGIEKDAISWLVPHQANIRIMQALAKRFDLPWEQVYRTIHKYGNTSSSTIPIALKELDSENIVSSNEYILLAAFGAGLTWGAGLLQKT